MKNKNIFYFLFLSAISVIGIWTRFSGILTNSFAFTYDVGRDLLKVHELIVEHKPFLIGQTTGLPGLFYGPWWYYFLSVPFALSFGNPQFIAGFMALVGVICIVLAFIIGSKIRDKYLGLTLASLLSFSPYFVGLSSQIWNPNISQLYLLLIFILFVIIFRYPKNVVNYYFILLGLLLGLLIDAEIVFGILIFIGVILSCFLLIKNKVTVKNSILLIVGFIFTQAPRFIFEFRHNFIQLRTITYNSNSPDNSGLSLPSLNTLLERVYAFNNMLSDTFTGGNKYFSIGLSLLIIISLKLFYKYLNTGEKQILKTAVILLIVLFIGILFLSRPAWGHYLIGLPVIYLLIVGLFISSLRFIRYGIFYSLGLLFLISMLSLQPLKIIRETNQPLWEGNAAVYRNQIAVVDYVYSQTEGQPFNLVVYTPAVHSYSYQYLFLWYGQKKYGYQPTEKKSKMFVVILEPDPGNEWRVKEWLDIRKDDGRVLKEDLVKGGIKVQIREH